MQRHEQGVEQLIADDPAGRAMTGPGLGQPSVGGDVITAETLRQVAEEVRTAFPRPLRAPELVLIDVDPRHIHAFWTIPAATVEAARRALAAHAEAPMVLRIHELAAPGTEAAAFDVEVVGLQGRRYVDVWGEARRYRGELGLRRPDGTLDPFAGSATVELPPLGPVTEYQPAAFGDATPPSEGPNAQTPPRPGEPVGHPLPLPPTEPSGFAPERLAAVPPPAGAAGCPPAEATQAAAESGPAVSSMEPTLPEWSVSEPPEPARHPFPLPPLHPSEFVPEALVGGFLPAAELGSERPTSDPGGGAASHEEAKPEPPPSGEAPAAEVPASSSGDEPAPLPLENVVTLSSWVLGRETVEFEINAELHIFGRARAGAQLQLFGRKVTLRPDGSFSITQPLPNGALVLSSLLVDSDDEGGER
jgi:uncharacterized protein DUF4912